MLVELAVRDLGVIEDLRLVLGPGMTALTGETGAGKTLVVEAIELLVGGRADPVVVRAGADEAWVEGRFVVPDAATATSDDEVVLARAVPADGRSRAYVDGRLATIAALAEWGDRLVDLHGQHAHQSLLAPAVQRARPRPLRRHRPRAARARRGRACASIDGAAGRPRRRRAGPGPRDRPAPVPGRRAGGRRHRRPRRGRAASTPRRALLADAVAHQEAAAAVGEALTDEGGAADPGRGHRRARGPGAVRGARSAAAGVGRRAGRRGRARCGPPARPSPTTRRASRPCARRRQLLHDLRRKYGETLERRARLRGRTPALAWPSSSSTTGGPRSWTPLGRRRRPPWRAAAASRGARRDGRPALRWPRPCRRTSRPGHAEGAGSRWAWRAPTRPTTSRSCWPPTPGPPPLPLAKVASGGELARTMLALRLVLTAGPPTLVFDEVDAGIGGEAAVAVGRSLAALGADQQVLVVTHLPAGGRVRPCACARHQGDRRGSHGGPHRAARRSEPRRRSCPACCRASRRAVRRGTTPRSSWPPPRGERGSP